MNKTHPIISSHKGYISASINIDKITSEYSPIIVGTYSEEKNRYGPSIISNIARAQYVEDVELDAPIEFEITSYEKEDLGFIYTVNATLGDKFPIMTPIKFGDLSNSYYGIFIGDNKIFTTVHLNPDTTYTITKYAKYDKTSTFSIASSYWEPHMAPLSTYYPALGDTYSYFISALHPLDTREVIIPEQLNSMILVMEYSLAKNSNEVNEIKTYINLNAVWQIEDRTIEIGGYLFYKYLDIAYQLSSGVFKDDTYYEDNGPDKFFWVPDDIILSARQIPYDVAIGVKNDEYIATGNAVLIRHNNIDLMNSSTMEVITSDGLTTSTISKGFPVVSTQYIDVRATLNEDEIHNLSFVTTSDITKESAREAIRPDSPSPIMQIFPFDFLYNPRPFLSHIPVLIDGDFKVVSIYYDIISTTSEVVRLNYTNYGGIFVAVIGKKTDGKLAPVAFRTSLTAPGKTIEIPRYAVEAFEDIYAIIDENTPKAEATFYEGDTYPYQKIVVMPRDTIALITDNPELFERIKTDNPDLVFYAALAQQLGAQFLVAILTPFGNSKVIKDYNQNITGMPVTKILL